MSDTPAPSAPAPAPHRQFSVQGVALEIPPGMLNQPLIAALESGRYQAPLARAVKRLLAADDVYFELGAGAGFLSTLAWRIVRDEARIHAYEANPALIRVIRRTWKLNEAAGNVYQCILGTGLRTEREFHVTSAFWGSSADIRYEYSRTITVPQRDFLVQLDKKAATFLVVDVEGGERDLLDKVLSPLVRKVVAHFHPRIIGAEMVQALRGHLAEQGFRLAADASEGNVEAFVR